MRGDNRVMTNAQPSLFPVLSAHSSPVCSRRQWLAASLALPWGLARAAEAPHPTLHFPRDMGSHPEFAIEWWYVTGYVQAAQRELGFQLTFFRSRVAATQGMTSKLAAKQLLFAHAAVTDVSGQTLWHDQRIARAGFGVAQASEDDTDIRLRNWSLRRTPTHYRAQANGTQFDFDLTLRPTQPVLLQGEAGWSRKGPQAAQASFYYSEPQLQTSGTLTLQGRRLAVQGTAWLDHEWSQALLDPQAVGWDWMGMNLLDGSALTAFRLRDAAGQALWAGGSWRAATNGATPRIFSPTEVRFEPLRYWSSPLTQARYPVQWRVHTPAGRFTVQALLEAQELDSRASTGAVYWEGLSLLLDEAGQLVGRGYLEMTGYASPLRL